MVRLVLGMYGRREGREEFVGEPGYLLYPGAGWNLVSSVCILCVCCPPSVTHRSGEDRHDRTPDRRFYSVRIPSSGKTAAMTFSVRPYILLLFPLLLFVACRSALEKEESLLVGAAISLQPVLDRVIAAYDSAGTNGLTTVSYAGSGTIRHQIEFGAPIDVYLSASPEHIDSLESMGLTVRGSRTAVASNTLLLIMSIQRTAIDSLADLRLPTVSRIAIGQPDIVPAGRYAFQALDRYGLLPDVAGKVVYTRDVQQVLVYVRTGSVDAGFVYGSDVLNSTPVRVIQSVPDSLYDPILYEGVVVHRSARKEAAARFLAYLASDSVQSQFVSQSFLPKPQ